MRLLPLFALSALGLFAQNADKFNHAHWTLNVSGQVAVLKAEIDPGWHMYSPTTPPGPNPTTISLADGPVVASYRIFEPPPVRKYDPNFSADTETYQGQATFYIRLAWKGSPGAVTFNARYQTCNDTSCIPPRTSVVSAQPSGVPDAVIPAGYIEVKPGSRSAPAQENTGLLAFLAVAFGVGLAAIFTPCVFPMIPITMSYFVGQKGGLGQAVTFCLGIVGLFTGLGLVLSTGVVQFAGSPWVNGFIALMFFVFGLSLLGAFEITIPSGILTKLNSASGQGGFFGALLMGCTFALASFACVGPFMGTLLAASVTGEKLRPVLGMIFFSGGLSLPFFLLALFPKWLGKLPRSGEWLGRVKVVMGFLVLATMLKYLYSLEAVLQAHILTRERFLAAAVVLVCGAGFYLLGFIRLPGIGPDDELGVGRLLTGMLLVMAGLSLLPGMFGGKLGELEAFIPQPPESAESLVWMKDDLPGALAKAKAENKRVLVDFTGYACTNCKWMKANMFTRPEIDAVARNLVLVELYTDGTDAPSQANQKLEEDKFQTVAIPFYVLYDSSQTPLATFADKTSDSEKYLSFLNTPTGSPAPAPTSAQFKTLDGAPLDLAQWKGQVVVVNYWATWCVPCREEIPEFNKMAADGVKVVGISMDDNGAEAVRPFLKQVPMNYPVGLGTSTFDLLPVTDILDANGNTVKRFQGFTSPGEIRAAIAQAQAQAVKPT